MESSSIHITGIQITGKLLSTRLLVPGNLKEWQSDTGRAIMQHVLTQDCQGGDLRPPSDGPIPSNTESSAVPDSIDAYDSLETQSNSAHAYGSHNSVKSVTNITGGSSAADATMHEKPSPECTTTQLLGLDALDLTFSLPDLLIAKGFDASYASQYADHVLEGTCTRKYLSPYSWPMGRKVLVLCGPFVASTLAAYSAGAYALASEPLRDLWRLTYAEYNAGITLFVAGFGFAPMILAPFSEAYGRYSVFVGAGVVFVLGTLGCAVTASYAGMMISRFITGSGASIFATLTAGVISDLFAKEDRNTPMALYSLTVMVGTGLGPLISGILISYLEWKWIFYVQIISVGVTTLVIGFFFKETRSNVILKAKCERLNKLHHDITQLPSPSPLSSHSPQIRFHPHVEERQINLSIIWQSFAFPMKLLFRESVVFWFSVWVSFAWAILYMQFTSIGIAFRDVYDFNSMQVGAIYTAVIAGSILGAAVSIIQDPIFRKFWPQRMDSPEGRLHSACIQSMFLPIGLFWFGWTANPRISWVSPSLAIMSCTMGIFSIYLAVFNYLADTYSQYASSALAAQSMCRNLLAGIFPLVTDMMLRNLTYRGAGSLLGGIGLLLTAIPWLLSVFGPRIRARSPFASDLAVVAK